MIWFSLSSNDGFVRATIHRLVWWAFNQRPSIITQARGSEDRSEHDVLDGERFLDKWLRLGKGYTHTHTYTHSLSHLDSLGEFAGVRCRLVIIVAMGVFYFSRVPTAAIACHGVDGSSRCGLSLVSNEVMRERMYREKNGL